MPVEHGLEDTSKKDIALSQRKRHKSWLSRERGGQGHKDAWRPKKRFRISAEKWIVAVDKQLQVSTGFGGLSFILPKWDLPLWARSNWRKWPHAGGVLDQGGDGLSGAHALLYKPTLHLCFTPWYDWTHGGQRDCDVGFKAVGHYSTKLLFLVIFNMMQGPDKEEGMRFQQLQECLEHMIEVYDDPANFELLCSHSNAILSELDEVIDTSHELSTDGSMGAHLQQCPFCEEGLPCQYLRIWGMGGSC